MLDFNKVAMVVSEKINYASLLKNCHKNNFHDNLQLQENLIDVKQFIVATRQLIFVGKMTKQILELFLVMFQGMLKLNRRNYFIP